MKIGKIGKIFIFILPLAIIFFLFYFKSLKKNETVQTNTEISIEKKTEEELKYNSNIIENVKYTSSDADGNRYTITALQGEIDYTNPNILYLTKVNGLIELKDSDDIEITSDYGKYNSQNFDTIFSKNVIINYLDNKIIGEYLDFSIEKNLLIISKKVIFTNLENILKADAIEMNIKTKDTKIFMYEDKKKVNIKNRN
tara:strand:+ start:365 stop:958 length:594 start_codon:yes stop_codon:yes gene_type:complete